MKTKFSRMAKERILALLLRLLWAAALVLPAFGASAGVVFTNLYSFTGTNDGANPQAGLVQGKDGYFYGTTYSGGTNNHGTIFKISTNGALTSLYSFALYDGAGPEAGLVQGSDGYFYGTTGSGGKYTNGLGANLNLGIVFKISPTGAFTSLHSFDETNGASPQCALVQGSDGYFYGTTFGSGAAGYGQGEGASVFKISTGGMLTNLHQFFGITTYNGCSIEISGQYNDGANPRAGLVQGSDGYFYGTTYYGGTNGLCNAGGPGFIFTTYGAVFKISTNGVVTMLHSFTGADGQHPRAGLVQGSDGNFYGTTYNGGTTFSGLTPPGYGTVFQITAAGAFTSLYSFAQTNFPSSIGLNPWAGLVQGSDGSFYGTTALGGLAGAGTVFRLAIVPPHLAIAPSGANVILSWPTDYVGFTAGFTLEFATNLTSPTVWQTNSTSPVVIGDQNVVTNPISGTQMFFRLTQ